MLGLGISMGGDTICPPVLLPRSSVLNVLHSGQSSLRTKYLDRGRTRAAREGANLNLVAAIASHFASLHAPQPLPSPSMIDPANRRRIRPLQL